MMFCVWLCSRCLDVAVWLLFLHVLLQYGKLRKVCIDKVTVEFCPAWRSLTSITSPLSFSFFFPHPIFQEEENNVFVAFSVSVIDILRPDVLGIRLRYEKKVVSISERVISMAVSRGVHVSGKWSIDGSTFCRCHTVHSLVCVWKPALAIDSIEIKYFSSCLN